MQLLVLKHLSTAEGNEHRFPPAAIDRYHKLTGQLQFGDTPVASPHLSMDSVIELGLELPGVEESPYYGVRALKLNGQMLACTPVNKSAEPNSAIVAMDSEQRAALLEKDPLLYYITEHYATRPTLLIRLSRMSRVQLKGILRMAWDYVSGQDTANDAARAFPRKRSRPRRRVS